MRCVNTLRHAYMLFCPAKTNKRIWYDRRRQNFPKILRRKSGSPRCCGLPDSTATCKYTPIQNERYEVFYDTNLSVFIRHNRVLYTRMRTKAYYVVGPTVYRANAREDCNVSTRRQERRPEGCTFHGRVYSYVIHHYCVLFNRFSLFSYVYADILLSYYNEFLRCLRVSVQDENESSCTIEN